MHQSSSASGPGHVGRELAVLATAVVIEMGLVLVSDAHESCPRCWRLPHAKQHSSRDAPAVRYCAPVGTLAPNPVVVTLRQVCGDLHTY